MLKKKNTIGKNLQCLFCNISICDFEWLWRCTTCNFCGLWPICVAQVNDEFSYLPVNVNIVSSHTRLWIFFLILHMDSRTRICTIHSMAPQLNCVLLPKSCPKGTQHTLVTREGKTRFFTVGLCPKGNQLGSAIRGHSAKGLYLKILEMNQLM